MINYRWYQKIIKIDKNQSLIKKYLDRRNDYWLLDVNNGDCDIVMMINSD